MKKILLTLIIAAFGFTAIQAQKIAFVDTEYILNKIPAYNTALEQIDAIAAEWQTQIAGEYDKIDQMYKRYRAEEVLLTDAMKRQKEQEIIEKEKQVKELQKAKFGVDGELFQKRQELIAPIQQNIFDEIEKMATQKAFDFIFDKSAASGIVFANDKLDKSDEILSNLGY